MDLQQNLADCVPCMSQLYQDWNAFLGQWFGPLVGLGHYHTFEFDQDHPGVMRMKTLPSDTISLFKFLGSLFGQGRIQNFFAGRGGGGGGGGGGNREGC